MRELDTHTRAVLSHLGRMSSRPWLIQVPIRCHVIANVISEIHEGFAVVARVELERERRVVRTTRLRRSWWFEEDPCHNGNITPMGTRLDGQQA